MDFPFHGMTEEEQREITPYIQAFIDRCNEGGSDITVYSAYNLSSEMFAINYARTAGKYIDEFVQFKWIYRGEEGKRLHNERRDRELMEDYPDTY